MRLVINPAALEGLFVEGGIVQKDLRLKAELMATKAKRLCPVDTGRLMGSIEVIDGRDDKGVMCLMGSPVEYAVYVEFGTRKMQAQPFLRPAVYGSAGAAPPPPWGGA